MVCEIGRKKHEYVVECGRMETGTELSLKDANRNLQNGGFHE